MVNFHVSPKNSRRNNIFCDNDITFKAVWACCFVSLIMPIARFAPICLDFLLGNITSLKRTSRSLVAWTAVWHCLCIFRITFVWLSRCTRIIGPWPVNEPYEVARNETVAWQTERGPTFTVQRPTSNVQRTRWGGAQTWKIHKSYR